MNKIKKLIFMVLAGYVLFFSITLNLYAKPTNSHVTDDGGVPGDTYTNLSLFPTIRVNSSGPRLSLVTNSFENGYNNILSNTGSSEDVMGKIKTDFQAFSVNTNLVRETFLIVSYRIYV
ncbi:MAG: hypothetical protein LBV58_01470, partial [Acholeplasmatales bacterium]|nr:hypothetical protein [Acholeplasmatales bacterium]